MKRNILSLTLFFLLFLFFGCEKEIQFKGKMEKPLLVMTGYFTPDSLVKVNVSRTEFVLGEVANEKLHINNADVKLYVNGTFKENLQNIKNGFYVGTYYPQGTDMLKIEASAKGFETIETSVVIPPKPNVELKSVEEEIIEEQFYVSYSDPNLPPNDTAYYSAYKDATVRLILDEPIVENYYCTYMYYLENDSQGAFYQELHFLLPEVLSGYINTNEEFDLEELFDVNSNNPNMIKNRYFNDFLFNGKKVELKYKLRLYLGLRKYVDGKMVAEVNKNEEQETYRISIAEVSKELYQFLASVQSAEKVKYNPFAEPVQIFSNVSNGAGIIGAYNTLNFEITLKRD